MTDIMTKDRCSQCGEEWSVRACGPTHALIYDYVLYGMRKAERTAATILRELCAGYLFGKPHCWCGAHNSPIPPGVTHTAACNAARVWVEVDERIERESKEREP